jgi:hypothetical protein
MMIGMPKTGDSDQTKTVQINKLQQYMPESANGPIRRIDIAATAALGSDPGMIERRHLWLHAVTRIVDAHPDEFANLIRQEADL